MTDPVNEYIALGIITREMLSRMGIKSLAGSGLSVGKKQVFTADAAGCSGVSASRVRTFGGCVFGSDRCTRRGLKAQIGRAHV